MIIGEYGVSSQCLICKDGVSKEYDGLSDMCFFLYCQIKYCLYFRFTFFGRNLRFFPVGTFMMELSDGFPSSDTLDRCEVMKQMFHT